MMMMMMLFLLMLLMVMMSILTQPPLLYALSIHISITFSFLHYTHIGIKSSLQLLYTDLLNDLKFVSHEQTLASAHPMQWMYHRNRSLMSLERSEMVNVYDSKALATRSKMYFEKLIIHPIVITFTFVQVSCHFPTTLFTLPSFSGSEHGTNLLHLLLFLIVSPYYHHNQCSLSRLLSHARTA